MDQVSDRLAGEGLEPAFDLHRADELSTPLIFASPHSGRLYPEDLLAASALGPAALRRSEDALVDQLIAGAVAHGATLLTARYARAYIDVNREPYELDPAMFEDELPAFARARTARVAAGLGAIARTVGNGQDIYARKLSFAEASVRIERVHQPYHQVLAQLLDAARARFGAAVLIDWHSMPSAAARNTRGAPTPDVVLGDCFGASCRPGLTRWVQSQFLAAGHQVMLNTPYAGGYTTQTYGDPAHRTQALQIEINRAIYLHEASLTPSAGFVQLKSDLERMFTNLAQHWRDLI